VAKPTQNLTSFNLDFALKVKSVRVNGTRLPADRRGADRLTSDPFIMMGMELGWDEEWRDLANRMLAVQESRYRETGQVTMVNEDAIPVPPYYFYYYTVLHEGKEFVIDAQGPLRDRTQPRWVS
jgi:hypothetical protein